MNILENVLDLIYPRVCGICGKVNTKALCNRCEAKIKKEFKFKIDNLKKNFNIQKDEDRVKFAKEASKIIKIL